MPVNYARLRNLNTRGMISALVRDGFAFDRGSGSHQVYCHPDGRRVVVTFHSPSGTFAPKTLRSMIEDDARWNEEDLKRLKLMK